MPRIAMMTWNVVYFHWRLIAFIHIPWLLVWVCWRPSRENALPRSVTAATVDLRHRFASTANVAADLAGGLRTGPWIQFVQ